MTSPISEVIQPVLIRYGEIALRKRNRPVFERKLGEAVALTVRRAWERAHPDREAPPISYSLLHGRLFLHAPWNEITRDAIQRTFGIVSFSPARTVPTELPALVRAGKEEFARYVENRGLPANFAVETRRSDKALPETSMQIDSAVGAAILEKFPQLPVKLQKPACTLGIEIRRGHSYVWTEVIDGPGGLPYSSNSKVLTLLSGGIDSVVAAIQMLKRGAPTSLIHFYGTPFVGEDVLHKVRDLAGLINRYAPAPQKLYVVPFGKIQEKIALAVTPTYRTLLYRRMMMRIATEGAKLISARALVTGDNLGQVSSQTLENMATVEDASGLPVLRPLLTYDKQEIVDIAHRLGTFETSIRPGLDCCTLFADRNPAIKARLDSILAEEAKFPVDEYVKEALAGAWLDHANAASRVSVPLADTVRASSSAAPAISS
ncbi:MAG: tRNA uracil 4-sulfurtransferase ThiI [Bacteriovoracia bacterium]